MRPLKIAGMAAFAWAAACGGGIVTEPEGARAPSTSRVHVMPVRSLRKEAVPANAHLNYYGGPVLANVKVWTVFWGSGVSYTSQLNSFYSSITSSAYFDWLSEYNTSTQAIGQGTLAGTVVDSSPPSGTTIDDSQIQAEIANLIAAGSLPPNDANNLYMVHFPPGITITQGGNASCSYFCAFHGTFTNNGSDAYYGVIPDMGGACATGCGTSSQLNNTTAVSSHEMIEAVTDPAVGLATTYAAPLAWYDPTNGEIGDICNGVTATVNGYLVQKEWSNSSSACIATKGTSCTPSCAGKQCGGDGCGGSCGTCPSGQTCGSNGTCQTSGGGGCAHPICSAGTKLSGGCDPCAQKVCASDPYCCSTQWDSQCVGEVGSICGQSCSGGGGGGSCAHPICSTGAKLSKSCDPCATSICTQDPYCCSTKWDGQCVSEVGSICGQTC